MFCPYIYVCQVLMPCLKSDSCVMFDLWHSEYYLTNILNGILKGLHIKSEILFDFLAIKFLIISKKRNFVGIFAFLSS